MSGDMRKIVIFENLRFASFPLALLYACMGFEIYCLKIPPKLINNRLFVKIQKKLKIKKVFEEGLDNTGYVGCDCNAINNIEKVYESRFSANRIIARMIKLLGSDIAVSSYKKALVEQLYQFFWAKTALSQAQKVFHPHRLVFIPEASLVVWKWFRPHKKTFAADMGVNVTFSGHLYVFVLSVIEKIKWMIGFFAFLPWVFLKVRKIVSHDRPKQNYQLGIRVYKTDIAFYYKYRTIDFLLNGKGLTKDNSLFCVETDIAESYKQELKKRDYHIVELPKILKRVSFSFLGKILIKKFLVFWFLTLKDLIFTPAFLIKTTIINLYSYILWQRFCSCYHIEHFVAYNDYAVENIIRNILLSKNNTKTWYYLHSRDFDDLFFSANKSQNFRWRALAYFNFDNLVTFGKAEVFLRQHPHHITNFVSLGCLWSEHVRLMSKEAVLADFKIGDNGTLSGDGAIVGVFNTDFGENVPLKFQDMVLFIEGIFKLLDKFPKLSIIFKEKYPRDIVHPAIIPYLDKLDRHPRCLIPGCWRESTEVISICDLIIGACFTSPVIEALGAGKKAIYFDASGRFAGTCYDKFPNLVAHSFSELESLTSYWLYQVSSKGFEEYLEQHIKEGLDIFSDGKAITRFRKLLTGRV